MSALLRLNFSTLVLILWLTPGFALGSDQALKQGEELIPDKVEQKLRRGVSAEDKQIARELLDSGLKLFVKNCYENNWGPIMKALGASAQYYPTPYILSLYGQLSIRSLAAPHLDQSIKAKRNDLEYALKYYESALAAQRVTQQLTADEAREIQSQRDCIKNYLNTNKLDRKCKPLTWIGLQK